MMYKASQLRVYYITTTFVPLEYYQDDDIRFIRYVIQWFIINTFFILKKYYCVLQMGVFCAVSGCFSTATSTTKGFRSRGNGILSPLIATVPANATRSTSGFKQTVENSGWSTMQVNLTSPSSAAHSTSSNSRQHTHSRSVL